MDVESVYAKWRFLTRICLMDVHEERGFESRRWRLTFNVILVIYYACHAIRMGYSGFFVPRHLHPILGNTFMNTGGVAVLVCAGVATGFTQVTMYKYIA